LLLRVLGAADETHDLHVPEVHLVPQHEDVQQLPYIPDERGGERGLLKESEGDIEGGGRGEVHG
jgi:hypothetical protein